MTGAEKILIVEDEKLLRMSLRAMLSKAGYEVTEAETGSGAMTRVQLDEPDLVLLDYRLPDTTGIEVLRGVREAAPEVGVILVTAYSSINTAVEAIKLGAYDYLNKPISQDDLLATISKALETTKLRREVRRLRNEQQLQYGINKIIGRSKGMQDIFVLIQKVATSAASTVLIQGESGTGKDLVAKAIHFASERSHRPFTNITCSALPENLLESELFGHERGAFTDAHQQKKGLVEISNGGTLFLDEISEMGVQLQAKLLRFLEAKEFRRIGGTKDIEVDVRVIAATNRNLDREVEQGRFREDLFFRLNVIPIRLPSLRERKSDIPYLVNYFIDLFNKEFRKNTTGVTPEMEACLMDYDWPGNVRELRNLIERAMILEDKAELDLTDLPEEIVHFEDEGEVGSPRDGDSGTPLAGIRLPKEGLSLREVEYTLVRQALKAAGGNQSQAARLLRISRDALRYKMKKFRLS